MRRALRTGTFALALPVAAAAQEASTAGGETADADMEAMAAAWEEAMAVGPEHQALADQVGTWKMTTTLFGPPGSEPEVSEGTVERAMELDGRVLVGRASYEMAGAPGNGIARTGYDNVTDRYWSTWTDNMSTAVILLWGEMDEEGGVFEGEFADPMSGGMAPMRIETAIEGPDTQRDTFYMPGPDGALAPIMEILYERQ